MIIKHLLSVVKHIYCSLGNLLPALAVQGIIILTICLAFFFDVFYGTEKKVFATKTHVTWDRMV